MTRESIGTPDIIGVLKDGTFLGVEVKLKGNKPSPKQVAWSNKIIKNNGTMITAYSLEDVMGEV